MITSNIIVYIITCAVAAATPGPGTISVITYSAFVGWRRTIPVIIGVQAGMLAMAALALSGIAAILITSPVIFITLQVVGVIYIAYLGVLSIRHAKSGVEIISSSDGRGGWRNFRHGAVVTFASPKTLLFFTSFFPVFIDRDNAVAPQMLVLLILLLSITLVIHLMYAYCMRFFKHVLLRYNIVFNISVGIVFIGMAMYAALQI